MNPRSCIPEIVIERRQRIMELLRKGLKIPDVMERLGVSRSTVIRAKEAAVLSPEQKKG